MVINKNPRPKWAIYKNDYAIGQAVTWHKALQVLVDQEGLTAFIVMKYKQYINITADQRVYKIIKER